MTPERLESLNKQINEEFENVITDLETEVVTEDEFIASTYARMIALSAYGYDLSAIAESATSAADKIMDLLESSMNAEEETV